MAPTTTPDLSLPPTCPALCTFGNLNWDLASFALYSLVDLAPQSLDQLVSELNREWLEEGNEHMQLVRRPETYDFAGQTLKDIVRAHVNLDKEVHPRENDDVANEGSLRWYPTGFIVVTTAEWAEKGLLFVYVDDSNEDGDDDDDEEQDPESRRMDKFFFSMEDAGLMLSSINFGDLMLSEAKDNHAMEDTD